MLGGSFPTDSRVLDGLEKCFPVDLFLETIAEAEPHFHPSPFGEIHRLIIDSPLQ